MKRRMLLKTAGAAVAITGVAGAIWANTRTPSKAIEPWNNRQPWKVDLVDELSFDLYCDLDRRLPHTDPYDRQILIGLGCFAELASIAASQKGYKAIITAFPDGEPQERLDERRIARISLEKADIAAFVTGQ
jgi:hypothetical protein